MAYTHEVVKDLYLKENFQLLSEYRGCKSNDLLKCLICDFEFERNFDKFRRRDKNCSNCKRLEMQSQIDQLCVENNMKRITEYKNGRVPLVIECLTCGKQRRIRCSVEKPCCPSCYQTHNKLTHEEVAAKYLKAHIELLSKYNKSASKNELKCLKCQNKWSDTYQSFRARNSGCPVCKTNKRHQKMAEKYLAMNIVLLSTYKNMKVKDTLQCLKCKYSWNQRYDAVIKTFETKQTACSECIREVSRIDREHKIKAECAEKNIDLMSSYVDCRTPLRLCCHECKHEWETCYYTGITSCPECRVIHNKLDKIEIIRRFKKKKIRVLEWYDARDDKRNLLECMVCDYQWDSSDTSATGSRSCIKCFRKNHPNNITHEQVAQEYAEKGIKLLSKYSKAEDHNDLQCLHCDYMWSATRHGFNHGAGCPVCNQYASIMENYCRDIIENMYDKKFPKVRHKKIRNPKTNRPLELDGYCEEIQLAFEYQGIQHYYEAIGRLHYTRENIRETRYRDKIKRDRCKKLGITLIEIPYWIKKKEISDFIKTQIG